MVLDNSMLIDTAELCCYLERNIEGFTGPINVEKFSGGQSNPTYKVKSSSGTYVLRKQPPGKILKSAHAVDREYRVITALADSFVPVPKTYHFCDDENILGSMFYLMEYCDGEIFWDASLPGLTPEERSGVYAQMNLTLSHIHSTDIAACDLSDYGNPGDYYSRQLSRWKKQYLHSKTCEIPSMTSLMEWLEQNVPEDDGLVSLVHGDYRLDNIVFDYSHLQALAVLDWELSTLGHPYADLSYQCMQLRLPRDFVVPGLAGLDRAALGIPTEQEYVSQYCEFNQLPGIANWHFYIAFSFFRLAAIIQGVIKRADMGNASNEKASELKGSVELLSDMALAEINLHEE